jgi:exodeoxyribonuclease V alpha subunit
VFADLCESPHLAKSVTLLTTSYRFGNDSGIGRLADSLRRGDAEAACAQLNAGGCDLDWQPRGEFRALVATVRDRYRPYFDGIAAGLPPADLFDLFGRFRLLCAHRQDVGALNRALSGENPYPVPGTPLMVLRNDALLRVFNGDIGLALVDPADGEIKGCFPGEPVRWIPLQRLPEWEPAWAMTVHKSQGSEFAEVLLLLPAADSPVATLELVYTGITRAKQRVTLWTDEAVLRAAIGRRAERMSGLRDKLR